MCKYTQKSVSVEALLWALQLEHKKHDRSGIYGYTQRTLAYNSNRIEGSTLTEDQTAALFEEGYLPATDDFYKAKDVEEMSGHFLMFNKMLSTLECELSEDIIKCFHYELKAGVFEDRANGYAIGDYKKRANTVGGLAVTKPENVAKEMAQLLYKYNNVNSVDLDTLARLHAQYELIHPFQDGNGRTGRIILFRECLKQNITPFIIRNENRVEYIAALKAATSEDFTKLVSLFEKEQEFYSQRCLEFDVEERYNYFKANTVDVESICIREGLTTAHEINSVKRALPKSRVTELDVLRAISMLHKFNE